MRTALAHDRGDEPMATDIQLDAMLTRKPGVCGGRLTLAGTRITVLQIVAMYKSGETPEEIAFSYPHISPAQVYVALAYYHSHQREVEQELADEEAEYERLKAEHERAKRP